jgi:hypothetical protein
LDNDETREKIINYLKTYTGEDAVKVKKIIKNLEAKEKKGQGSLKDGLRSLSTDHKVGPFHTAVRKAVERATGEEIKPIDPKQSKPEKPGEAPTPQVKPTTITPPKEEKKLVDEKPPEEEKKPWMGSDKAPEIKEDEPKVSSKEKSEHDDFQGGKGEREKMEQKISWIEGKKGTNIVNIFAPQQNTTQGEKFRLATAPKLFTTEGNEFTVIKREDKLKKSTDTEKIYYGFEFELRQPCWVYLFCEMPQDPQPLTLVSFGQQQKGKFDYDELYFIDGDPKKPNTEITLQFVFSQSDLNIGDGSKIESKELDLSSEKKIRESVIAAMKPFDDNEGGIATVTFLRFRRKF